MSEESKGVLTLEPNMDSKSNILEQMPVMKSVVSQQSSEMEISAGTIDESMLSEEEKAMVEQFASEIDISNAEQTIKYGYEAQRNISDFSTTILKKAKTYELGEVGTSLKELTVALNATMEPEKKGLLGAFQKAKRGIDSIKTNYAKAETNVNRIEKDLRQHQEVMISDINMYDRMYVLNIEYYKQLTMYIIAGKKALLSARNGRLLELKAIAERTEKQEDVQAYRDFEDQCMRFEKKIGDLETSRMISIQMAPQVRLLENNDREMLDKLQSSLSNTIPLWRNQLVISLGLEHTRRAVVAQKELADKTNELLVKNAEMLKMASIETAKEAERPMVEIATLRQCNRDLITSINEVIKIHEQGTAERQKAHDELVKIEEELKTTLLTTAKI